MSKHKIIINSLEQMKVAKQYWVNIFSTPTEKLVLPTDFERKIDYKKESISFELTGNLYNRVVSIAKCENLAIYVVLLSVLEIQLFKYSVQNELTVGTPVYYKSNQQESLNTVLLMKSYLDENITFKEIILNLRKTVQDTYENQVYPLEEFFKHIDNNEVMSLLPVSFIMKNIHNKEHIRYITNSPKNEMTFLIEKNEDSILFEVIFNSKLFKRDTVKRFCDKYLSISHQVFNNLDIKLNEIEFVTEEEKQKILYEFNDTYADYPKDKTIHELFEQQAERTPNNIAVVFEDKKITYRELNEKANRLARSLRKKGVKPESIVGIMVERSIEMIVGIMGVLKSGGAYLPIEPEYPKDRKKYMFYDSKINILLTQCKLIESVEFDGEIIDLEDEEVYSQDGQNLENINTASDLAYVIYTSGSTGKPKGVMIEQKGLVNYVFCAKKKYLENNENTFALYTSFSFDLTVTSIFVPLIFGGKIVAYFTNDENNVLIREILKKNEVSVIKMTPAHLELIKDMENKNSAVKTLIIGGEDLKTKLASEVYESFNKNVDIYNEYGPTEAAVGCILYKYDYKKDVMKSVLIGKPADNVMIYILDKFLREVLQNVPGEIYISGDGLARGYLNKPELTAEKFIESPFIPGQKMYKTGDLARWLPDGNIEFIGRMDHQVKIRGFRIELGEIENQLLNHENIKEAIVIDREDENGAKYLCAYLVSGKELTIGELRNYLSKNLPEYMIPSYFVGLEKMPLTTNGKIDRNALPKPDGSIATGVDYEAPRNGVEEKLAAIWSDVLGIERVGINDNFFELGGHSLKATILVGTIHKEFNVEVPLIEIFNIPTIKGISEYIESTEKSIYSSIEIVEEKEYYEASSAQKRMYMLQQFDLKSTVYNMPGVMLVEGKLEAERLEESFALLIRRHETLRTSVESIEDKIVQRVNKSVNFKVDWFEVGSIENQEKAVDDMVRDFVKAFDLNKAPLLRIGFIKLEEDKHILMLDMHHIISDGVSMGILINEFANIYEGNKLEKLRIQYKDYSQWQNMLLKSEAMQEQKEYWINRLSDEIPVLSMATDFKRPIMQSSEGENIRFKLDKEMTKDLKRVSKETGSTMYMVLLSGVNILLSKYSGQEDIIVGSPIAGRPHADLEKIIGMFVNTLVMRNNPEGGKTYEDFLKEVRENALKAYENQDYQFDELVDNLSIPRDISRNPLFDVMFEMQNIDSEEIELKDLVFKEYKQEYKVSKFDLTFSASEVGEEIILNFEYCTKLYKRETIERMVEHFVNIIKVVTGDIKIKLSEIEMLTEKEKHKLLYEFNDTYVDYPRDKTIHELFEEQVEKTPYNVAAVFKDKKLTYKELNKKANQLARVIRNKGIKPNNIVGIMVDRSMEMIIGILAILKAGGVYLPIDPDYPMDRKKYMLEDSKANILLTKLNLMNGLDFNNEMIDIQNYEGYEGEDSNLQNVNISTDLIYIIYTSGSTGNPKGVMVQHKNVVNISHSWKKDYHLDELQINLLQMASFSFDVFTGDLCRTLLNGGQLIICPTDVRIDFKALHELIQYYKINILESTPTLILGFMEYIYENGLKIDNLKLLIIGSDMCPAEDFNKINERFGKGIRILNSYGVTEVTIDSSFYELIRGGKVTTINVPIGKPMQNTKFYILNHNKKVQQIGAYGELYIGGDGVAKGYLNKPELTVEKFIDNPFIIGETIYKTGDLARWLPDGNIEFLGRIDNQVKIRGFRIELGEIENSLLSYEFVKKVIVLDREDENSSKYLCAYLVSEKKLTVEELRKHLSNNLPEYMIPSYFVQLDKMPLTPNGKVDRKALPEPDGSIVTGAEYEEPRNEVEEKLVAIWKDVLGLEKVGINDSFFELGGHSLKATTLVSKIHKELSVEVPLREIFKFPTIKGTSEYIESTERSIYSSIELVEKREYYEASSAQKRMYILQQFDLKSTGYNMPGVMLVEGRLEVERLEKSFNELISRHETLRTSFETIEDKIVQRINESVNFKLDRFKVGCKENQEKDIDNILKDFVKVFDLNKSPLLRVGLIKLEEEKHILLFDMHHIISDGVSVEILTSEFAKIYEGNKLERLRIQYKDYSAWQNKFLESEGMQEQKEYWINRFTDEIPVLNMPTDFIRPAMQSFEGENIIFKLDKELTRDLKRISKETSSTMYMVLLSGVNILLSKYSGQEDIIVGSPIAGRPHADLLKIIGIFVNTLVMRNHPDGSKTYEDFLKEVRENALKAYENQDYQFDELVDKLSIPRDISRNPLFDVMFTMQNIDSEDIELKKVVFKGYKQEHKVAKFDLTFTASETVENIMLNLQYSTKLYKRETIERMIEHFVNILKVVAEDTKIKINEIDMLTEGEKHKLLFEFNNTYADYPRNKTIHELFEEQVEKTPDNTAVVFDDECITYRDLNKRANVIAKTLVEKGVRPDSTVGIIVERSLETIVGIMAILKAGGAYLPIDPEYPADRIMYMLQDSKTKILLSQSNIVENISFAGEIIDLNDRGLYVGINKNLNIQCTSDNLAYVIYTSGTTGKPKGVGIKHSNITNYITWFSHVAELQHIDKTVILTSLAFDLSYTGLYSALLSGCEIHIIEKEMCLEPEKLISYMSKNGITFIKITPSLLNILVTTDSFKNVDKWNKLRFIAVGGENIKVQDINKIHEFYDHIRIMNHYGPTETTIGCIANLIDFKVASDLISIGKPVNNTQVYILDKYFNLLPVGVVGEICIGGDGIGAGYINSLELMAEKNIIKTIDNKQFKLYRTGDYGKFLGDGSIEFIGRIDNQVKIRGFRVEIEEIENVLLACSLIKETVVTVEDKTNGDKYLCAYVVMDKEMNVGELRQYLHTRFADYMIPSYFVQLDKIPLTPNGKINRKALPKPDGSIVTGTEYEAPRNEVEEKLVIVWSEVLGVKKVGIKDNFFELGGDSIKGIQVLSRMRRYGLTLEMKQLFTYPTIEMLSKCVETLSIQVDQGIVEGEIELSPIQKWFFGQNFTDMHYWNQAVMLYNKKGFDKDIIQRVFDKICIHHDLLRTVYEEKGEEIIQFNRGIEAPAYSLEVFDFKNRKGYEKEITTICTSIQGSIDLRRGPLMKLGLFKTDEGDHLLIVIHHLIVDGVSWRILFEDFSTGYKKALENEEIKFQEKTSSYRVWTKSLKEYAQDWKHLKELEYWKQIELSKIKLLPKDFKADKNTRKYAKIITLSLDKKKSEKLLKEVNKAYNTEINDILLTTLGLAIKEWSGENKVCINMEGHGREDVLKDVDITRTIGWFTSHYPVILDITKSDDLSYAIKETKETLRRIPNKGIGYSILKYLTDSNLKENIELKLKPEINFNYLGQFDQDVSTNLFRISSLSAGSSISMNSENMYAIDINGIIVDGELSMTFAYNEKEYKESTIKHLADEYMKQLESIIAHCLSKQEREFTPSDLGSEEITVQELEEYMVEMGMVANDID